MKEMKQKKEAKKKDENPDNQVVISSSEYSSSVPKDGKRFEKLKKLLSK